MNKLEVGDIVQFKVTASASREFNNRHRGRHGLIIENSPYQLRILEDNGQCHWWGRTLWELAK